MNDGIYPAGIKAVGKFSTHALAEYCRKSTTHVKAEQVGTPEKAQSHGPFFDVADGMLRVTPHYVGK